MKLPMMIGVAVLAATAVGAQNYPHAWEVNWITGVAQPIHRHQYDMAAVYLRYGPIRVTAPDGTVNPASAPFEVPRPFFQPKGVTHREEAIGFPPGTPERMAIMFDLKEVVGPRVTNTAVPTAFPREGAKTPAIDNPRVLEWDHTWQPGKPIALHIHDRDSVQVFMTGGTIRFTDERGKQETKTFAFKDARFIPRGTIDSEEAVSGSPHAVTIELK
jgi:hypothetical protein